MKTAKVRLQCAIPTYQPIKSQDRFLTTTEVASILRVSVQSLKLWRKNGTDPPHVKINQNTVLNTENSLFKRLNCDCTRGIRQSQSTNLRRFHKENSYDNNQEST